METGEKIEIEELMEINRWGKILKISIKAWGCVSLNTLYLIILVGITEVPGRII